MYYVVFAQTLDSLPDEPSDALRAKEEPTRSREGSAELKRHCSTGDRSVGATAGQSVNSTPVPCSVEAERLTLKCSVSGVRSVQLLFRSPEGDPLGSVAAPLL